MTAVLGSRFRFSWTDKDKGALCHQARCKDFAVSHHLCAVHGAYWLSRGRQPPMPEYEADHVDMIEALERDALDAERDRKALGALPMRNAHDAEVLRGQLLGARALIEQTRGKQYAAIRPLLDEALRLRKAHSEAIAAYRTCEELILTRLQQFEHLHDFEVARPKSQVRGKSVRPPAAKKKGSRRRA